MHVSIGKNAVDNKPQQYPTAFEWPAFVGWLYQWHQARQPGKLTLADYLRCKASQSEDDVYLADEDKDFHWFNCAAFGGDGLRRKANVTHVDAVPLDSDSGHITEDVIRQRLAGFAWAAYTSYSHSFALPKWRIVVPLERSATPAEFRATWLTLSELLGGTNDVKTGDPGHIFFLPGPTCSDQFQHRQFAHGEGRLFPVSAPRPELVAPVAHPMGWRDEPIAEWPHAGETDEQLIERICSHKEGDSRIAGCHVTGRNFWDRDAIVFERYASESDADLGFMNIVLPVCGFDWNRTIDIAKQSPYYAGKDTLHERKWDRASYWKYTLGKVMDQLERFRKRWTVAATLPAPLTLDEMPSHMGGMAHNKCSDQANADRMLSRFGTQVMMVAGKLYSWCGTHWEMGDEPVYQRAGHLSAIVREEMEVIAKRAAQLKPDQGDKAHEGEEALKSLAKWARQCEMSGTQSAAVDMLSKRVVVGVSELDKDPMLLNCLNGTIDLRTGELRPHNWRDRITKLAPVTYDPSATAPNWDGFLSKVFDTQPVRDFVQRWHGYSATGCINEHAIAIQYGGGSNGKTTLTKLMAKLLGSYSGVAPAGLLTGFDKVHDSHIAALRGLRYVTVSESDESARLREGTLKMLTGGDTIVAKFLYGEQFTFNPTHKLQYPVNSLPSVRAMDHGMWRRLKMIPFPNTFGTAEEVRAGKARHIADTGFEAKLMSELSGVLNWVVAGALAWQREGLNAPAEVLEAIASFKEKQDLLGSFIQDHMELGEYQCSAAAMYVAYQQWCNENGIESKWKRPYVLTKLEERFPGCVQQAPGQLFLRGMRVRIVAPSLSPPGTVGTSPYSRTAH